MSRTTAKSVMQNSGTLVERAYGAYKRLRSRSTYSFQDRVVLITGGSRGLGLVMARQLVEMGAKVALLARDAGELERAAEDLRTRGGSVLTITGDVGQREAAERAVEQTVAQFGQLDVLINNAGIIQIGPFEHMTLEDFELTMAVHFWGPLFTTRAALPYLARQEGARIVNIASFGGKLSFPHLLPYCASKFALVGLSEGLRIALSRHGIPVTTVCPGLMRTGSHLHVLFKGKQRQEYSFFTLGMATPLLSSSAITAASKILRASQRGDAELVINLPYKLLSRAQPLFPKLTTAAMVLLNQLLPGPGGRKGDVSMPGWACRSQLPWALTFLADRAALANNELPYPPTAPASVPVPEANPGNAESPLPV